MDRFSGIVKARNNYNFGIFHEDGGRLHIKFSKVDESANFNIEVVMDFLSPKMSLWIQILPSQAEHVDEANTYHAWGLTEEDKLGILLREIMQNIPSVMNDSIRHFGVGIGGNQINNDILVYDTFLKEGEDFNYQQIYALKNHLFGPNNTVIHIIDGNSRCIRLVQLPEGMEGIDVPNLTNRILSPTQLQ